MSSVFLRECSLSPGLLGGKGNPNCQLKCHSYTEEKEEKNVIVLELKFKTAWRKKLTKRWKEREQRKSKEEREKKERRGKDRKEKSVSLLPHLP